MFNDLSLIFFSISILPQIIAFVIIIIISPGEVDLNEIYIFSRIFHYLIFLFHNFFVQNDQSLLYVLLEYFKTSTKHCLSSNSLTLSLS